MQSTGTVAEITSRIQAYSNSLTKKDSQDNVKGDQIHFWDCEEQPSFEAVVCEDNELMYRAECSKKPLMFFQVEKDGVGLESGECRLLVELVDKPCVQTRFGSDVLFTNQKMSTVWHLKPCS